MVITHCELKHCNENITMSDTCQYTCKHQEKHPHKHIRNHSHHTRSGPQHKLSPCTHKHLFGRKGIKNTRVCFSTNLPSYRRISSFLDNPHLPSFACDSKSYSTFGRWFLLYSQSFLKICSHIPQCIKNTMVSAQPEVKWRLGGYELYVNVM